MPKTAIDLINCALQSSETLTDVLCEAKALAEKESISDAIACLETVRISALSVLDSCRHALPLIFNLEKP